MDTFSLPKNGATLHGLQQQKNASAEKIPQAICLNLGEATVEEILKSFTRNEKVRLRFGKRQMLHWGAKSRQVYARREVHRSELYSSTDADQENFFFSGAFSHRLETEEAQKPAAQEDESLAELTQSLNSLKEEAVSNEARIITNKNELKSLAGNHKPRPHSHLSPHLGHSSAFRKDRTMTGLNRSTSGSPFLGSSNSPGVTPRLGPTSAPASNSTATSKEQIRLDAIKVPLTHLLAYQPLKVRELARQTGATQDECQKLLNKFAVEIELGLGKYKLKDKAYKELNVFKFPYASKDDRRAAIDRSISAFDRMRLPRSDKLWQLLLPQDERGKGKCLSRLNFDGTRPAVTARSVKSDPKNKEDKPESVKKAASSSTDVDSKRQRESSGLTAKAPDTASQKRTKGSIDKKSANKPALNVKKPSKPNTKYKSSEIIEDSDEEAEMSETQTVSPTQEAKPEPKINGVARKEPEKKSQTLQRKDQASLQKSKTAAQLNNDRSRLAALNGRPRTGSSPQKPSPLAASPPTNAKDVDDSSKSSSSGSSTPLMSRSLAKPTDGTRLPASKPKVTTPAPNSSARPVKRPADTSLDEKPAKRRLPTVQDLTNGQHLANGKPPSQTKPAPQTNGTTKQHARHDSSGQSLPPLDTDHGSSASSSSTSSSSPPVQQTVEGLNELSEYFRKVYAKYEALHQKLQKSPERSEKDMETLHRMHKRVAEIKAEVWKGWRQLQDRGLAA
ncbi:MAG: hypothetical protein Q9227_000495 [Pyrenula ochraceoflavens]